MAIPPSTNDLVRAAGYLEAANNLLAQRFNYALAAHSMSLIAYATCLLVEEKGEFVAVVVAAFGIFYAVVQYFITAPLARKISALREAYVVNDPVYQAYMNAEGGTRPHGLQSVAVPAALAVVWTLLLWHALT